MSLKQIALLRGPNIKYETLVQTDWKRIRARSSNDGGTPTNPEQL